MITAIAAISENHVIGKDNGLPWRLPDDLKRFKALTLGHHVIMGRKTYESLPVPLKGRPHIVISRQGSYQAKDGAAVAGSLDEALALAAGDPQPFIIGGGEIFKIAMPLAEKLEITLVCHAFDGDAFFPKINDDEWQPVFEEPHPKDDRHAYDFIFKTYLRKRPSGKL